MKLKRKNQIDEIAEQTADKWGRDTDPWVDPYLIAGNKDIEVFAGELGDSFRGLIKLHNGVFTIFINTAKVNSAFFSEGRQTCSHELGHYFLRNHRCRLREGKSLAFIKGVTPNIPIIRKYEEEAQQFAASLLMPKTRVISYARNLDLGFEAVIDIKNTFKTSVLSTLIRYVELDIGPCVFLTRNSKGLYPPLMSKSFYQLFEKRLWFQYNPNRPVMDQIKYPGSSRRPSYVSSITSLSSWTKNIETGSMNDILVYEHTMDSRYGSWTLIFPAG